MAGHWVGVGTAMGAVAFAFTREPVWIALGVAIGAASNYRGADSVKASRWGQSGLAAL